MNNTIEVSNKDLEQTQNNIRRDLLIYNNFHKNANLPYLEVAKTNFKKDLKDNTHNSRMFFIPQKATLGINPSFNQNISKPSVTNNTVNNYNNDNIPLNIYRNFSQSTRQSKKTFSNYDMCLRNQYK